jgi:hypothetical protein
MEVKHDSFSHDFPAFRIFSASFKMVAIHKKSHGHEIVLKIIGSTTWDYINVFFSEHGGILHPLFWAIYPF